MLELNYSLRMRLCKYPKSGSVECGYDFGEGGTTSSTHASAPFLSREVGTLVGGLIRYLSALKGE